VLILSFGRAAWRLTHTPPVLPPGRAPGCDRRLTQPTWPCMCSCSACRCQVLPW
jgi:hypothetical protein